MANARVEIAELKAQMQRKQDKINKLKEGSAEAQASKLMAKVEKKMKKNEKKKKHKVGRLLETGGGKPEAAPSRPPRSHSSHSTAPKTATPPQKK